MAPPVPVYSLSAALSRCAKAGDAIRGASLHALCIKLGSSAGNFTANSIINLYTTCLRPSEALLAFEDTEDKDVGSYNNLINGLSKLGHRWSRLALILFNQMRTDRNPISPDSFTIAGVLTAVCSLASSGDREAHGIAIRSGLSGDVFVGSALLNCYCKFGSLSNARKLFDGMPVRNSVTWATIISGYAAEGCIVDAIKMFKMMVSRGDERVNEFVVTGVLSALVVDEFIEMGEQVHCYVTKCGLLAFVPVRNAIITMYSKCGCLKYALEIFESSSEKSSVTWSAMVTGYAQNGRIAEAFRIFSSMHICEVVPSEHTFVGVLNACSDHVALVEGKQAHAYLLKLGFASQMYIKSTLVDMYAKCNDILDAKREFVQIQDPDVVLWTTMISGCVNNGENEEALNLYMNMKMAGLPPNDLTLASVLRACSCLAILELGKQVHAHVVKHGYNLGTPIGSALSNMYAKCGDLDDSSTVFRRIPARDIVAWNSIISAFAHSGRGSDALQLFEEMKLEGIEPNQVSFINVLSACSHIGLVGSGLSYFRSMTEDYGLIPSAEHYACMVDILSRAGLLEEAKSLAKLAPLDCTERLWRIILGGSVNYHKFDIGAYAGEKLLRLGTTDSSAYILLSNIYAASGKRTHMERVRATMKSQGINKDPGCSWIEMENRIHVFLVRDQLHPKVESIYATLRCLSKCIKDEDHPDDLGPSSCGLSFAEEVLDDRNPS